MKSSYKKKSRNMGTLGTNSEVSFEEGGHGTTAMVERETDTP